MVVKADHERIKTLLKDTITLLCRNGLNFKTEFSVEALIGITLDKEDVVLVSINEIIRSELGSQITLAKDIEEQGTPIKNLDAEGSGDSRPSTPVSTNGHQYRKRKRSPGHVSQKESTEDGQESDSAEDEKRSIEKASLLGDESNSEPSSKRTADEPSASRMPCIKDDTKDVIYIKEEIDTGDWPDGSQTEDSFAESNIPAASSSDQQHEDNFDFLHSSSLVPVSSDTSVQQSWGDVSSQSAPASLSISPSKRPSMATGMATQGEHSQKFGQAIYSLASRQGCVQVKHGEGGSPIQYTCTICFRTVRTRRGFEAHMGQHLGVYRYNCSFCRKGFPSTTALKDHQRSHTGQKLLCPACGKQFVSYSGLSQHLKVTHQWSSLQVRNQMHCDVGGAGVAAGSSGGVSVSRPYRLGGYSSQPQFPELQAGEPAVGQPATGDDRGSSSSEPSCRESLGVKGSGLVRQAGETGLGVHHQPGRYHADPTGGDGGTSRHHQHHQHHQTAAGYGEPRDEMPGQHQAGVYRQSADRPNRHHQSDGRRHSASSPGVYISSQQRADSYLSAESVDDQTSGRQQTDSYSPDDPDSVLKETFQFDPDTSL